MSFERRAADAERDRDHCRQRRVDRRFDGACPRFCGKGSQDRRYRQAEFRLRSLDERRHPPRHGRIHRDRRDGRLRGRGHVQGPVRGGKIVRGRRHRQVGFLPLFQRTRLHRPQDGKAFGKKGILQPRDLPAAGAGSVPFPHEHVDGHLPQGFSSQVRHRTQRNAGRFLPGQRLLVPDLLFCPFSRPSGPRVLHEQAGQSQFFRLSSRESVLRLRRIRIHRKDPGKESRRQGKDHRLLLAEKIS